MRYIRFLLISLTLFTYQLHAVQNLVVNVPGDSASAAAGNFTFGSPTASSGDLRGCLNYINTTTITTPAPFAAFALEELENSYNVASTFFAQQVG